MCAMLMRYGVRDGLMNMKHWAGGGDFEEGMTQLQVQKARYSATFFLPQIPHRLIWDLAGAFAVRSSH